MDDDLLAYISTSKTSFTGTYKLTKGLSYIKATAIQACVCLCVQLKHWLCQLNDLTVIITRNIDSCLHVCVCVTVCISKQNTVFPKSMN